MSAQLVELLDRARRAIRARHYSHRTERAYIGWIKRFISFHGNRYPDQMGEEEVTHFLSNLATERKVSPSTQNQALSAVLFLYQHVLGRELDWLDRIVRAKRPLRVPIVLSTQEVSALLNQLHGTPWLMASLLYGAGLRVLECARLRVKDVDIGRKELVVRDGKGRKDRVTLVPITLVRPLAEQLRRVERQHRRDLDNGAGYVELPYALRIKYPRAAVQLGWQ